MKNKSIINHEQSTRCEIINNFRKLIVVAFFAGAILLSLALLCSFSAFISLNFAKFSYFFRPFWYLFYSVICEMRNFCVVGIVDALRTSAQQYIEPSGGGSVYGAMH